MWRSYLFVLSVALGAFLGILAMYLSGPAHDVLGGAFGGAIAGAMICWIAMWFEGPPRS